MAAEQMKKVTGHLGCPICCELYKKPKYLPCYHSYCEECLVKLVVQSNITCPECRKTSIVPSGGVKQLPNNFFINRLLDEVALKHKVEGEEEAKCDLCVRGDAVEVLCMMPLMVCKGKKTTFKIVTKDQNNHLCDKGVEVVKLSFRHNHVEEMSLQ